MGAPTVQLFAWDARGRALLDGLNTIEGKRYLGGPETAEKLDDRHARYLTYRSPGLSEMLMIAVDGALAGATGYWRESDGPYEAGWEVLPAYQGKGIARRAATMLLERAQSHRSADELFAYPAVENLASNRLCATLGFNDVGTRDMEYPRGVLSPHRVWRLDLGIWKPPIR